jgi:hypothetical protein
MDGAPTQPLDYAAPVRQPTPTRLTSTFVALVCYLVAYVVGGVFAFTATELDDRRSPRHYVALCTLPTSIAFATAGLLVLIVALIRHPFRTLESLTMWLAILYRAVPLLFLVLGR